MEKEGPGRPGHESKKQRDGNSKSLEFLTAGLWFPVFMRTWEAVF